jgi:aminoglycoside phosphotransferase (APT) family kinase protein
MTIGPRPSADVVIDPVLVHALLEAQHPDLAELPLVEAGEGWDNHLYRLGDALGVRLPRRTLAADLIVHEQRWLPMLAAHLPLPVPVPVRSGRPGCGFPWPWSIVPWFEGDGGGTVADPMSIAEPLARFLRALHRPAPDDAPRNLSRGGPLVSRTSSVLTCVTQLGDRLETARVMKLWDKSLNTAPWAGPALWLHGDLHPGNLVVRGNALAAVIDFGDITTGDPATDLSVAWALLPPPARCVFREAASNAFDPIDDLTWDRARGWALTLGLAWLARGRDDPNMEALGHATVRAVLADDLAQAN